MSSRIKPLYSSSRIKAAGKRLRDNRGEVEDMIVLENWRAAHSYVLNTFQANLRQRARGKNVTVAQRLKRRPTIIDKLRREPTMQLNKMHDMAGCRMIFENIEALESFRTGMLFARFQHKCKSASFVAVDPPLQGQFRMLRRVDRYNYIEKPKESGYRGIHDVYEYQVKSQTGKDWNGLHLELQYRTVFQHAWATAVEVADLITANRIKFSQAANDYQRFFRICSELIARFHEFMRGSLPLVSNSDLVTELGHLEQDLGIVSRFRQLRINEHNNVFRKNSILIFTTRPGGDTAIEVKTFDDLRVAIERYEELERELGANADVVLVRADTEANVRFAFKNYFSDTADFLAYLDAATDAVEGGVEMIDAAQAGDIELDGFYIAEGFEPASIRQIDPDQ